MNERIKQLIEQATTVHEPDWNGCERVEKFDKQKFAELIVKECGAVQHRRFCEHGDVSWDILMEHFGITE